LNRSFPSENYSTVSVPILYRNSTEWTFQFPSSTGSVPLNTGRELEPVLDWCRSSETVPCAMGENRGTAAEPIGNSSSVPLPQFRNCTLRKGTRCTAEELIGNSSHQSHLVPQFRICTLAKRWNRGTAREQTGNSSHQYPLSNAVPKLYSAKRGNRGTAEVQIGNSSHQHTRAIAAAPNKQLRNGNLSRPVVPPFTRQEAAIRNALRLMGAGLIFGFYRTEQFGIIFNALGYKSSL